MQSELRQAQFDYSLVPKQSRQSVESATSRLHTLERRTSESIIEIGKELLRVKADIGHGNFLPWLKAEFGWSARTAQNFMAVSDAFGDKYETVSHLSAKVLYALSAHSTPDEVRIEFTELAALGQRVTPKDVQERIKESRRAEPIPVSSWERDPIDLDDVDWEDVDENTGEILDPPVRPVEVAQPPKHEMHGQVDSFTFTDYGPDDPELTYASIATTIIREYGTSGALRVAEYIRQEVA